MGYTLPPFPRKAHAVTDILLHAQSLSCERDDRLLFQQVSFTLGVGQVTQIIGPNGAGKTTLLRALAGLYGGVEGEIRWPQAKRQNQTAAEHFFYLGHRTGLRPELTALQNLSWLLALHGQSFDSDRVLQALAQVSLGGFETVPVAQLSAGQNRRVLLSLLWLLPKKVWLLDEPFTALDASGGTLIEQRIRELAAAGAAVLYSSHHSVSDEAQQIVLGEIA